MRISQMVIKKPLRLCSWSVAHCVIIVDVEWYVYLAETAIYSLQQLQLCQLLLLLLPILNLFSLVTLYLAGDDHHYTFEH